MQDGLQVVSFGEVAKRMGISKSGVCVRCGSLTTLHSLVLDEYDRLFAQQVFLPALREPKGLPRLDAIFHNWLGSVYLGADKGGKLTGSLFAIGAFEFNPQANPLRDRLLGSVARWRATLTRSIREAVQAGHLQPDTDAAALAFAISTILIGHMHDYRFVKDPRVHDHVVEMYRRLMSTYRCASS